MEALARRAGPATRAERAGIEEEALTRDREEEIMREIGTRVRGHAVRYQPHEVRESFVSGRPMLTYQELFIIEEMKRRNTVAGVTEQSVAAVARRMIGTGGVPAITGSNAGAIYFNIQSQIDALRLAVSRPFHDIPAGPTTPYAGQFRERRRRASAELIRWYDALPGTVSGSSRSLGKAARFLEWTLIAEKMSDEWVQATGASLYGSNTRQIQATRRAHHDFLTTRLPTYLRGLPPLRSSSTP
jgi:hypothetical protein